jgi:hypothetical protein
MQDLGDKSAPDADHLVGHAVSEFLPLLLPCDGGLKDDHQANIQLLRQHQTAGAFQRNFYRAIESAACLH